MKDKGQVISELKLAELTFENEIHTVPLHSLLIYQHQKRGGVLSYRTVMDELIDQ